MPPTIGNNGTGPKVKNLNVTVIQEEHPKNDSRYVIFAVKSVLFKAYYGSISTILYLWTSTGWQLYIAVERILSEDEVYAIATKTAGEFNLPL